MCSANINVTCDSTFQHTNNMNNQSREKKENKNTPLTTPFSTSTHSVYHYFCCFLSTIGPALNELAAAHKWEITGDMCFIRNQEELIKPKKILAKIELDSKWWCHTHLSHCHVFYCMFVSTGVSGILATIASR